MLAPLVVLIREKKKAQKKPGGSVANNGTDAEEKNNSTSFKSLDVEVREKSSPLPGLLWAGGTDGAVIRWNTSPRIWRAS
jgi:hypothetical protein